MQSAYDVRAYIDETYDETELFVEVNEITNETPYENCIKVVYFMMTTLTSVGFGDFRPHNTYERILCIIIFLFVMTAFSGLTGYMTDLLAQ